MTTVKAARQAVRTELDKRLSDPAIVHFSKHVDEFSALVPPYIVVRTVRRQRRSDDASSPFPTSRRARHRWLIRYNVTVVVSGADQDMSDEEKLNMVDLVADTLTKNPESAIADTPIMEMWDDNVDYTDFAVKKEDGTATILKGGSFDLFVEVDFVRLASE